MKKYPHMLPNEIPLWERFLSLYGKDFKNFRYDIHVGRGVDPGPDYDPKWRKLAIQLTQKRIDVVGERDGVVWIFEVKPDAGLSAIGQLLAYRALYRRDFNYTGEIKLAVVTTKVNADEFYLFNHYGIIVYEVGYV